MFKKFAFVCSLAAAFVLLTSAKSPVAKFDKEVTSIVKDMDIVGLATTVVSGNKIIFSKGYGVKNTETQEPMTTDAYFRTGIAGRLIVPMAVFQCVDNGLIDLKDDVSKYLGFELRNPDYPETPITVKMLLMQNSSLMDAKDWKTVADVRNSSLDGLWNDAKPGTKYKKCSNGFILLAAIVEKVVGVTFEEYAKAYIFEPLGIDASYTPSNYKNNRVASYVYKDGEYKRSNSVYSKKKLEGEYVLGESTAWMGVNALLTITTDDMAKVILTVMNNGLCPLTNKRLYSEAASAQFLKPNKANTRCAGLSISTKVADGKIVYHGNGWHKGTFIAWAFEPISKVGYYAACNGTSSKEWTNEMRDAFAKAFLK